MVQLVPLPLDPPTDELLKGSPLRLVAFQLRHTGVPDVTDVAVGLRVQQALEDTDEWRLEPLQGQRMTFSAQQASQPTPPSLEVVPAGWRLQSQDGQITISLTPDSLGLETTSYAGWGHFSGLLKRVLDAYGQVIQPQAETRLGLRYINRMEEPKVSQPSEWQQWIEPQMLGMLAHRLGSNVVNIQQQVQLAADRDTSATVQHGSFRDQTTGRLTYFIDLDVYREGVRPFDGEGTYEGVRALHTIVLQLFRSMLTSEMYQFLKGE